MFCSKCGAQIKEGARFCGSCGAPVDAERTLTSEPVTADSGETAVAEGTGRKLSNRDLIIIGVIALAVVVVIMLFAGISGGYRKPIRQYFKGYEQFNAGKMVNSMAPFIYESAGYSKSEFKAEMKEELDLEKEYASEMDNFKISYSIEDVRDCGSYETVMIMDDMAVYYGLDDADIPNVRKIKSVDVDITVEYDYYGEKYEETDSGTMYVGKIGSKWYMIDMD